MEAILVKVTFNPADGTVNRIEERTWYEFAAALQNYIIGAMQAAHGFV